MPDPEDARVEALLSIYSDGSRPAAERQQAQGAIERLAPHLVFGEQILTEKNYGHVGRLLATI